MLNNRLTGVGWVSTIIISMAAACGSLSVPATVTPRLTTPLIGISSPAPNLTARPTPRPTAGPMSSCQPGAGSLQEREYPGVVIQQQIPYQIYLPDCLREGQVPLPVMYFFHGKPYDETHWLDLGVIEVYQSGVVQGRWAEAVLVFAYLPEPIFSQTDGGTGSYEQEFIDGLLPEVESRYPAGGSAHRRLLVGISRGGVWALEIGLANPDLVARVGALSPSLAVNYPRPVYDPFVLARETASDTLELFLLAGQDDWARWETERLAAVLGQAGLAVRLELVPGQHLDSTWQNGFEPLFEFALSSISSEAVPETPAE